MHSIAQMVGQGYRFGAPSAEAEEIDVQVAQNMKCRKCGGPMRYEGYHRQGEYVALAICIRCGHETAF
jgi:hypothetical protein